MSNRYVTTGEAAGQDHVHSITSAAEPHTQDMGHRMKVYATQMGLRVVCLIVFVVVDNFWVRAVALVGVAVLPWVAVMLANSGADRSARTTNPYVPPAPPVPAGALGTPPADAPDDEDLVLEGEFVAGHGDDDARAAPGPAAAPSGSQASSATVEDDDPRSRGAA